MTTALVALGLTARLGGAFAYGTQDVEWWKAWGGHVVQHGLLSVYGSADDGRVRELFSEGKHFDEVLKTTQTVIPFKAYKYGRKQYVLVQPPLYIYSLSISTSLYASLVSPSLENDRWFNFFLNVPPILYSAILALLIGWVGGRVGGAALAVPAGLLYWLNPLVILNSPVQGYQDPLCVLFATASVVALHQRRLTASWVLLTLGTLTKPQGVLLAPVVLWCGLLEHDVRANVRAWLASAGSGLLVALPFLLGKRLLSVILGVLSIGGYSSDLTRQAMNIWWPVQYFANARELSSHGLGLERALLGVDVRVFRDRPIAKFAAESGIDAAAIGFLLLGAFTLANLWTLRRRVRADRAAIVSAAALQAYAYFMLRAGVQINHYFVIIPLTTILAVVTPASRLRYGLLCAVFLVQDLTFYGLGRDYNVLPKALCDASLGWVTVALAVVNAALFGAWVYRDVLLRPPGDVTPAPASVASDVSA